MLNLLQSARKGLPLPTIRALGALACCARVTLPFRFVSAVLVRLVAVARACTVPFTASGDVQSLPSVQHVVALAQHTVRRSCGLTAGQRRVGRPGRCNRRSAPS